MAEELLPACGECGALKGPNDAVHGMSGCPFFLCDDCWDNGVRFEEKMKKFGWVPAPREIPQTDIGRVGDFITEAEHPFGSRP